jgi:SP family general alpha glucoside:H+ symporter-like MFS transporter
MTAAAAIAFTIGPFVVALIVNSFGNLENRWAYRGIFVAQYGITAIGFIVLPFMPE